MTSKELAKIAVDALEDKKVVDLRIIDISEVSVMADYFIIGSGTSHIQVQALANNVEEKLHEDIKNLTSERDVQKVNVDNLLGQLSEMKAYHDRQMTDVNVNPESESAELKASQE